MTQTADIFVFIRVLSGTLTQRIPCFLHREGQVPKWLSHRVFAMSEWHLKVMLAVRKRQLMMKIVMLLNPWTPCLDIMPPASTGLTETVRYIFFKVSLAKHNLFSCWRHYEAIQNGRRDITKSRGTYLNMGCDGNSGEWYTRIISFESYTFPS